MTTLAIAWGVSAGVLLLAAVGLGVKVRDGDPIGILVDNRGRYSLTQLQLVLWTIVILSVIIGLFTARLLDDASKALDFEIPNELLAVLGISVGSTAAAAVVKSHNDAARPESVAHSPDKRSFVQIFTVEEGALADKAIDIAKFQNFWFTLVLVTAYVALCVGRFHDADRVSAITGLPGFDSNFVTLLGISHAGYIAGKLPSRDGEPNAPTARPLKAPPP